MLKCQQKTIDHSLVTCTLAFAQAAAPVVAAAPTSAAVQEAATKASPPAAADDDDDDDDEDVDLFGEMTEVSSKTVLTVNVPVLEFTALSAAYLFAILCEAGKWRLGKQLCGDLHHHHAPHTAERVIIIQDI